MSSSWNNYCFVILYYGFLEYFFPLANRGLSFRHFVGKIRRTTCLQYLQCRRAQKTSWFFYVVQNNCKGEKKDLWVRELFVLAFRGKAKSHWKNECSSQCITQFWKERSSSTAVVEWPARTKKKKKKFPSSLL